MDGIIKSPLILVQKTRRGHLQTLSSTTMPSTIHTSAKDMVLQLHTDPSHITFPQIVYNSERTYLLAPFYLYTHALSILSFQSVRCMVYWDHYLLAPVGVGTLNSPISFLLHDTDKSPMNTSNPSTLASMNPFVDQGCCISGQDECNQLNLLGLFWGHQYTSKPHAWMKQQCPPHIISFFHNKKADRKFTPSMRSNISNWPQ